MAILKVLLVSLTPSTSPSTFLDTLNTSDLKPLIAARVIQWIITPTYADYLLTHHWDYLLILSPPAPLPSSLAPLIAHTFSTVCHEPDTLLK
jgi:hypothetical protein